MSCNSLETVIQKKPLCGFCYKEDIVQNLKYCANCEQVRYCSRQCQVAHWRGGHRFQCRNTKTCPTKERIISYQPHGSSCPIQNGQEEGCPICMETLLICPTSRVILPCQHAFHRSCVEGLRAHGVAQVCPICRAKLPPSAAKVREAATMRYFNIEMRVNRGECSWETLGPEGIRELRQVAKQWQAAADDGDVLAQLCIGNKFMAGMGDALLPDIDNAEHYLSLAAEQGNPQAQFNLGTIYYQKCHDEYIKHNGPCCSSNVDTSQEEIVNNSDVNNSDVNDMVDNGETVSDHHRPPLRSGSLPLGDQAHIVDCSSPPSQPTPIFSPEFIKYKNRVYRLWSLAAEQDDPNALYNLAMMYKRGCGTDDGVPNIPKALYLLRRAAEMGNDKANETIACIRNELNI